MPGEHDGIDVEAIAVEGMCGKNGVEEMRLLLKTGADL